MEPNIFSPQSAPAPAPSPVKYPDSRSPLQIALYIVLGIIISAVMVFGGYMLGSSSEKSSLRPKIDASESQITELQKAVDAAGDPLDQPGVTYLNIQEWGIRLPLDSKFKDVQYKVRNRLNSNFVELYSPTLAAIATCRDYQGEIGTIERSPKGSVPITNTNVAGFGEYIYMYGAKTETCTSNPADVETPYKTSVLKQFAKLEKLPGSNKSDLPVSSDQSKTTSSEDTSTQN